MSTIVNIEETDLVSNSRATINDNFASLNTNKQEVEVGKGLSTNDFTTVYKDKLANLAPNYSLTPDLVDSINNTLNDIAISGGGILYLLPGTYTLTSNINIPSGCTLEGTSRDNSIIDCDGTFGINMKGDDIYDTGTVTINNGDTTVVGLGTTFTSGMVGQSIWLDGAWYGITTFTSAAEIEIDTYLGENLAGAGYEISTINDKSGINKLTITNTTGAGLTISHALESKIDDIVIYGCGTGIDMDYVMFPKLELTSVENGINLDMNFVEGFYVSFSDFSASTVNQGVVMNDTRNSTFFNSSAVDNAADGVKMINCSKIAFVSNDFSGNGASGIEFNVGCDDNQITDCIFNSNTTDGIKITSTSDRNSVSQISVVDNGGYGINIAAASCDNNILLGVIASGNVTASLNDSGTSTLKSTAVNILP